MYKFFALLTLSLISSNSFAQSKSDSSEYKMIEEKAGFKKFKFREQNIYTISTKKFSSQKDAERFCESQKMTLDKGAAALFFAMSFGIDSNKFLSEAIRYKLTIKGSKESGIWFWAGEENVIMLFKDGGGMSNEAFTAVDYEKKFNKKPEIPAICTITLKEVAETVNKALVEVRGDKTLEKDIEIQNGSRDLIKDTSFEKLSPSQESRTIKK